MKNIYYTYYAPKNEVILYSIRAASVPHVTRAHDQYDNIIYTLMRT